MKNDNLNFISTANTSRRGLLKGAGGLAALGMLGLSGRSYAQAGTIVLSNWGGEWGAWTKENQDAEFGRRTGMSVTVDPSADNAARLTKIKLSLAQNSYDVVSFADSFFARAEAEGVLQEINYKSPDLENHKDVDTKFLNPYFAAWAFNGFGLGYVPGSGTPKPTRWADLWRPEYKGKIALPAINHSFGLYVLFACSIASGEHWQNVDAGFEMLKKLVDQEPTWFLDSVSLTRAYAEGEVAVGWIGKGEVIQLANAGTLIDFVIPEEGGMYTTWGFAPVAGTRNTDAVTKYINVSLDPQIQAATAEKWGFHPTNRRWKEFAKPEVVQRVSWKDEDVARLVLFDQKWINERRSELSERVSRIVSQ